MEKNELKSRMFEEAIKMVLWDYHDKEIDEFNRITENDRHIFSSEFESKMSKILKRGKRFRADFKIYALKFLKKSGVIALIVLSISFLGLLTVEAVREEIYKIITTAYEKFIRIGFGDMGNQVFTVDFPPERIEESYLPSYVPDGYWEDDISQSDTHTKAIYINNENDNIIYYQKLISSFTSIDGENYIEDDININGMNGKIYEYDKPDEIKYYIIIWTDSKYSYQVIGYVSKEDMVKIAESVIIKN